MCAYVRACVRACVRVCVRKFCGGYGVEIGSDSTAACL